jgi:uncharacterized protein (TIGR00251 family)
MLTLEIKVTPSAGRQGCSLDKSGMLKCALKSPPERNKANEELIILLADALGLRKDQVTLVSGHTSRKKRLKLATMLSYEEVLAKLGIAKQLKIGE